MPNRRNTEDQSKKDAKESARILERVAQESESLGTSSLARTAGRIADHFSASDHEDDDRMEILGKRIGRALALVVVIALIFHLVTTYVLR
ncbi:MAG: hypothetical protein WBO55_12550 [Rhizobiaceae bacterium]